MACNYYMVRNICPFGFWNFFIRFVMFISNLISGRYFANWPEKVNATRRAFDSCGGTKLRESFTSIYADSVIFMVAEFADNTFEVVPENWASRPRPGEKGKGTVAIPASLDEVCCPLLETFLN
jgi:hypothetical protein